MFASASLLPNITVSETACTNNSTKQKTTQWVHWVLQHMRILHFFFFFYKFTAFASKSKLFAIHISARSWGSNQAGGILLPGSVQSPVGSPHSLVTIVTLQDNAGPGNPAPPRAPTKILKLC